MHNGLHSAQSKDISKNMTHLGVTKVTLRARALLEKNFR